MQQYLLVLKLEVEKDRIMINPITVQCSTIPSMPARLTFVHTSVIRVGSDTFGDPIFQKGLAILPNYKCPGLICLALPARQKFGLILVMKFFLVEVIKKLF